MAKEKTTLTLETSYGVVSVALDEVDMTLFEVVDGLVRPVLLAAGYHPELVDQYFEQ